MKRAKITLWISIICVVFTFLGLLLNEGVFGSSNSRVFQQTSIKIWRDSCDSLPTPPANNVAPFIVFFGEESFLTYFTGEVLGTARVSFSGEPISPWNFYQDCTTFGIDLRQVPGARLLGARFQLYLTEAPLNPGEARALDQQSVHAEIEEISDGLYSIRGDAAAEVASVELDIAGLLKRTGISQFGFDTVPWFAMVERQDFENVDAELLLNGNVANLLPLGSSQRTIDQHSGSGMNAIISHIESTTLGNANRIVSILLSTLLGLFIGAVFESTLVLATIREIHDEVIPVLKVDDPASEASELSNSNAAVEDSAVESDGIEAAEVDQDQSH